MKTAIGPEEMPPGVMLRRMTRDDIPAGLALCRAAKWNQLARDWELFLALEPQGATVAERDSRVVGTVTTLHFGAHFGWIAMVLVEPSERGRGVGRALLLDGLHALADVVARLDATPAGEVLYRKLGFEIEYHLSRLQRDPGPLTRGQEVEEVRRIDAEDWPGIAALDREVFGADRKRLLTWLADGAPEYALAAGSPHAIDGFVLGRHGHNFEQIGPVVAKDDETARRLVGACLSEHADRRFILDAPDAQASWRSWLSDAGFSFQRPFARMARGRRFDAGDKGRMFASIGAEFG